MNTKELSKEKLGYIHRPFHKLNAEVEQLKKQVAYLTLEVERLNAEVEVDK
jgi:cell division protein FtsB